MQLSDPSIPEKDFEFFEVADIKDLPSGERLFLELNDRSIIIFNVDGEFFAIDDECTHDNGPLGDGELDNHQIVCPRHGARFDIRTGKTLALPAVRDVTTYPIRLVNEKIEIGVKKEE